ncbi:hypothetical protein [Actinoallomurus sp. CA-142502]|uniref:phage tail tube protein n=1 Tax=Actinoallomurus sp. CA-142502 TaxID=3239885 RepID=UPI003D926498
MTNTATDLLNDGMIKVTWVPGALADVSNPTLAELTAPGVVDLQWFVTKDGLDLKPDTAAVDNTALASTEETQDVGMDSHDNSLTCKRKEDSTQDVAYNTLTRGAVGTLVVRRNLPEATAYAAGQNVETYPSRCGLPALQPPEKNAPQKFMVKLFNYASGDQRATVAA